MITIFFHFFFLVFHSKWLSVKGSRVPAFLFPHRNSTISSNDRSVLKSSWDRVSALNQGRSRTGCSLKIIYPVECVPFSPLKHSDILQLSPLSFSLSRTLLTLFHVWTTITCQDLGISLFLHAASLPATLDTRKQLYPVVWSLLF